ncbi:MAG: PAS domain-containing protein, partial [Promethearchaeota archaeon]
GNWDWNIQTNELHWSDEIYRIFGLAPQEFGATYEAFLNSVHPEDRELVKQSVDEALYERKPYSIDHHIVLPDGEVRIVHEQAEVTFDETGRPVRMMGTVLDITERKKLELQLIESEKRYRGLYESSIDGILSVDMDNRIIECNHAFAEMLGYTKDELSKLSTSDITPSNYHDMVAEIITGQVITRGHSDEFETELLKKDGKLVPVSARIWLIKDKEGNPEGTWGIVREITERKMSEETLKNGM